jgi:hypothetical protein
MYRLREGGRVNPHPDWYYVIGVFGYIAIGLALVTIAIGWWRK